jgi:hypothetical protein
MLFAIQSADVFSTSMGYVDLQRSPLIEEAPSGRDRGRGGGLYTATFLQSLNPSIALCSQVVHQTLYGCHAPLRLFHLGRETVILDETWH